MPEKEEIICAFTGHRAAKLAWKNNEADSRCVMLKENLSEAIEELYGRGVRLFIGGMANGCDMYFAEAVLKLRETYPDIRFEAAVPYPEQPNSWSTTEKERYRVILEKSDNVVTISRYYTRGCMMERNRYMVDRCNMLLACYDGVSSGGTLNTLRYALKCGKELRQIDIPAFSQERFS